MFFTSFKNEQLLILYWSIADEQCDDSFRWTSKGLSHTHTHTYPFSSKLCPPRLPYNIEQRSLLVVHLKYGCVAAQVLTGAAVPCCMAIA